MDGHHSRTTPREQNLHFVGSGVSGGEEGLVSPSSCSCSQDVGLVRDVWTSIAKVDSIPANRSSASHWEPVTGGVPCTAYIGTDGSGHYVKMVHNGIEYGDMQMICESFHLMSVITKLPPLEIGRVFDRWDEGELDFQLR